MPQPRILQPSRSPFTGWLYQILAIVACVLLGLAMILNNQMGGEAMWFWYATIFHHGAKLYSHLHTALQPLFVLETDVWMKLVGKKLVLTQIPSLLHLLALCVVLLLVLRESVWPDWQKAFVLLGVFCLTVCGHSYRFDDYHVIAETFIFAVLLLLLLLARSVTQRGQLLLTAGLGVVCGLTITTRLTDGAAALTASVICLPFLLRRQRLASLVLLVLSAALTILLVVRLTGDTFRAYLFSSVIHAAGSKGGTGSIFAAPFLALRNTFPLLYSTSKQVLVVFLAMVVLGAVLYRYRRLRIGSIFAWQMAAAAVIFCVVPQLKRAALLRGSFLDAVVLSLIIVMYVLPVMVLVRFIQALLGKRVWDPREVLVVLTLGEWASYSAGAAAEPLTNYYAPIAMLLLLVPILQPFRKRAGWVVPAYLTLMTLLAASTFTSKAITPYAWQNYRYSPMFENRQWYRHPVYGEMYIDRDLLHFSEAVCSDIGEQQPGVTIGTAPPPLLSLPYPFPNYFCNTPPWHEYVQTFFDTSTRATIEHLMAELQTAPPEWVIYQRQLNIMRGAERLYNHGQPLAQRALDTMIMQKLASGQWKLVDRSGYLATADVGGWKDGGWYIIQTHP
jgi:hypothetical protein